MRGSLQMGQQKRVLPGRQRMLTLRALFAARADGAQQGAGDSRKRQPQGRRKRPAQAPPLALALLGCAARVRSLLSNRSRKKFVEERAVSQSRATSRETPPPSLSFELSLASPLVSAAMTSSRRGSSSGSSVPR